MARRNTSFADDLIEASWWISVILAVLSYGLLKYAIPAMWGNSHAAPGPNGIPPDLFLNSLAQVSPTFATPALLFFLMMAALSLFNSFRKDKNRTFLFNKQRNMETLRSLSWQDFEKLVGEIYRRKGYTITETGGEGPDGGVDLVLKKNGETILVQCKHWKMESVGVLIVRQLLGVVYDKKASGGIVITSGTFTQEAIAFSKGNPIQLVNGKELLAMIDRIKKTAPSSQKIKPAVIKMPVHGNPTPILCPLCGSAMVLRTAKKGPTAGSLFYGCSTYPKCKGTRPHES
ncbi:MAG: restriction endonuclease [Desulfomonilia bacterium]